MYYVCTSYDRGWLELGFFIVKGSYEGGSMRRAQSEKGLKVRKGSKMW